MEEAEGVNKMTSFCVRQDAFKGSSVFDGSKVRVTIFRAEELINPLSAVYSKELLS